MSYISSSDSLPPIQLRAINNGTNEPSFTQPKKKGGRSATLQTPADIRWVKVQEFLRSSNLSLNSRKSYERELRRFLNWTELHYHELRPRHFGHYKEYLIAFVKTEAEKPLSKSSINSALTALKSFFNWFRLTYPEILPNNPTVGVKERKSPTATGAKFDG